MPSTGGSSSQVTGKAREIERFDRLPLANDRRDGLAAEARLAHGEDRLVGKGRDHAKEVAAGNVIRRQYTDDTGMGGDIGRKIAQPEGGAVMGRADGPDPQCIGGTASAPKRSVPSTLGAPSSRAMAAPTAWPCSGLLLRNDPALRGIFHRIDDLGIARAAAEDAAQRIGDHLAAGCRLALQQGRGGNQHARRADAALRCTARQEGLLQHCTLGRVVAASPSMVTMLAPSACAAGTRQAQAVSPSISTVQAPQSPGVAAALGAHVIEIAAEHLGKARRKALHRRRRACRSVGRRCPRQITPAARSSASPTRAIAASRR